ncbi:MAG: metalloregulator ArsR/SmtB family transcription factor [Rhodospirillales bacterium]|nr:metalloregulator ArsR/SmtB family transcription factor [Rhodospirillales bacterium]
MNIPPKISMFEQFAIVAKALSSSQRLNLLELLAQGERDVEGLAKAADLSIANASQHLQVLRRSGLVVSRKRGPYVLYRLSDDDVLKLLAALRHTAERHLAEVDRLVRSYFREKDGLKPISHNDLMLRMKEGLVTVLDVRSPDEYAAGHLPGSINIPLKNLKRKLGDLPKNPEIIAYCRGPYCVLAYEAIAVLRANGRKARRMEDGFPEWRAAGLPVETACK